MKKEELEIMLDDFKTKVLAMYAEDENKEIEEAKPDDEEAN